MGSTIVIKGVDEESYRNFKGEAIKAGLKVGQAASEAFRLWVRYRTARKIRDRDLLEKVCEIMDRNRSKTKFDQSWDSAEVIRRWRDVRRR